MWVVGLLCAVAEARFEERTAYRRRGRGERGFGASKSVLLARARHVEQHNVQTPMYYLC